MSKVIQDSNGKHKDGIYSNVKSFVILRIEKVRNEKLMELYELKKRSIEREGKEPAEKWLFYGSRFVEEISEDGFKIELAKDGTFGYGLYFASNSSKSNFNSLGGQGYDAHRNQRCEMCTRKMLLCKVMLGKIYEAIDPMRGIRGMRGFDSISVSPGPHLEHPEWIVYQESQVYSNYKFYYKVKN